MNRRTRIVFRVIKTFAFVVCFGLCVVLMLDVGEKYFKKMTNMGIVFTGGNESKKKLPCLTLCPWPALKNRKFCYKEQDYVDGTFNMMDILFESTMAPVNNSKLFYVTEVRSIYLGRCYMVCFKMPSAANENIQIVVQKNIDILVFIHSEENKLWVSIAKSVIDLTTFVITSSSLANVTSVEIVLTERRTKSLNKEHMPCVQYPDEKAYNDCVRTLFASTLKSSINCTLPGNSFPNVIEYRLEHIPVNYSNCQNEGLAIKAYSAIGDLVYGRLKSSWIEQCPVPCVQTSYTHTMKYYHTNSWINPDKQSDDEIITTKTILSILYKTLLVEERVETLIYDAGSFLAAAGGNLGLLLGFSCLSLILGLINLVKGISFKTKVIAREH